VGRQQDDDGVMPRHRVMRGLTAVATVLVGLGYLLWRASATLTGVPVGLAVAALSVEIAGAAATFALPPGPLSRPVTYLRPHTMRESMRWAAPPQGATPAQRSPPHRRTA
jgi:hypothetical protein